MPPRKRLGQLLTELGVVDEHQLQSALGHQKQWGGKLGSILVQKGFCSEPQIVAALAGHLGMPMVSLAAVKVDARAVKFVSKQIAEKLHVFPFEVSGSGRSEVVTIAMSDPTDLAAVDQLAFHTGKRIKPILAGDSEIVSAISQHYGTPEEKKVPTEKTGKPTAVPGDVPPGPPAEAFPRRFDPQPGGARPSFSPPPPAQRSPEPAPEPLDLPEPEEDGKGSMLGLEPIAAHSQDEAIAGEQELPGEGAPADPVQGFEPVGVRHEGADQASAASWTEAAPQADWPKEQGGGWGAEEPRQQWTEPAEPAAGVGWDAQPAADVMQWSEPESGSAPGSEKGAAEWGGEAQAAAAGSATQPEETDAPPDWSAAEEAPDAWAAASDDPLAAGGQEPPASGEAAAETAAQSASTSPGAPDESNAGQWEEPSPSASHWGQAPAEDKGAAWIETPPSAAGDWGEPPAEAPAEWSAGAADELPTHGIAEAEGAKTETAAAEDAVPAEAPEDEDFEIAQEPLEDPAAEESPEAAQELPGDPAAEAYAQVAQESPEEASPAFAEEPSAGFSAEHGAGFSEESLESGAPGEPSGEQGESHLESWVAPPSDEQEPAAWTGQGLAGQPLSPADEGTLASVGVDPNDGVAALRTLAALVRVLQRRQLLDPDELAAELRDHRTDPPVQGASESPASPGDLAAQGETPGQEEAPPPQDLEGSSETQTT